MHFSANGGAVSRFNRQDDHFFCDGEAQSPRQRKHLVQSNVVRRSSRQRFQVAVAEDVNRSWWSGTRPHRIDYHEALGVQDIIQ